MTVHLSEVMAAESTDSIFSQASWMLLRNGHDESTTVASVLMSTDRRSATLVFDNPAEPGIYDLVLAGGIRSEAGLLLEQGGSEHPEASYSVTFTVSGPIVNLYEVSPLELVGERRSLGSSGVDASGNSVVVWSELLEGGSTMIVGQRFAADGSTLGGPFAVSSVRSLAQGRAAVAVNRSGAFVVVWDTDGVSDLYARQYDPNGFPIGDEITIARSAPGQYAPRVAMDDAGRFVVVWDERLMLEVLGQRFTAAGVAEGPMFVISNQTAGWDAIPAVAMDSIGRFVVTWQSQGGSHDVFGRQYSQDGSAIGDTFEINQATAGVQAGAEIAMNEFGEFVVAWRSTSQDPDGSSGVYARRYSSDGTPRGNEFSLPLNSEGEQTDPRVAMDNAGGFVVAWVGASSSGDGTSDGFFQRVDPNGFRTGTLGVLDNDPAANQSVGSVSVTPDGDLYVAWADVSQTDISLRLSRFGKRQGDYDYDGSVDAADYSVWRTSFGNVGTTSLLGDGDADGDVDGSDFLIWQRDFGATDANNAVNSTTVVLESNLDAITNAVLDSHYPNLSIAVNDSESFDRRRISSNGTFADRGLRAEVRLGSERLATRRFTSSLYHESAAVTLKDDIHATSIRDGSGNSSWLRHNDLLLEAEDQLETSTLDIAFAELSLVHHAN